MATHEEYLVAYDSNMNLIASLMLISLAAAFFMGFLFGTNSDDGGSGGGGAVVLIGCAIGWLVSMVVTAILAIWIIIRKSKDAVMWGLILVWPQSMFPPLVSSSVIYIIAALILPTVITALVIRLLWLQDQISKTRPPFPVMDYPVDPYGWPRR